MPLLPITPQLPRFGRLILISGDTYRDWDARAERMPGSDAWRRLLHAQTQDPAFATDKTYQKVVGHGMPDGGMLYATPTDNPRDPGALRRLLKTAVHEVGAAITSVAGNTAPDTPSAPNSVDVFLRRHQQRIQRF